MNCKNCEMILREVMMSVGEIWDLHGGEKWEYGLVACDT